MPGHWHCKAPTFLRIVHSNASKTQYVPYKLTYHLHYINQWAAIKG